MSNNLNLASKPFSNRLLPWVLTAVILFISVVGLVVVIQLTTSINRDVASRSAAVNTMKQEEQALITKGEELKRQFSIDKQQALQAAHQLVDRKGFSWSRLFADLEDAVPDNVRVSRIAVRAIGMQGDQTVADLELTVFAKSANVVTAMIRDMDRTGIFQADLRVQNLQKGRGRAALNTILQLSTGRGLDTRVRIWPLCRKAELQGRGRNEYRSDRAFQDIS